MAASGSFSQLVSRFFGDNLAAMSGRSPFGRLVQQAVNDPAARERLVQSPEKALADAGVALPEGMKVEVLENTERVIHLVLPPLVESQRGASPGGTA